MGLTNPMLLDADLYPLSAAGWNVYPRVSCIATVAAMVVMVLVLVVLLLVVLLVVNDAYRPDDAYERADCTDGSFLC